MEDKDMELFDRDPDMDFDEYDNDKPENTSQTIARIAKYAAKDKGRLSIVFLSILVYTALNIAAPYYSAGLVNLLWENIKAARSLGEGFVVTWQTGGFQIFVLALLYLGAWGSNALQSFIMASFSERMCLRLRTEMGEKLNRLQLSYYDKHKTGEVLSHFTNDIDRLSEVMQTRLLRLVSSGVVIIGAVVMMFVFNWIMTLVFLGFMGLSVLVTTFFSKSMYCRSEERQEKMSAVTATVEEYLTGRTIIKAFSREGISSAEMHRVNRELSESSEKLDRVMHAIPPLIQLVNRLGEVVIAIAAGYFLLNGRLSVGILQAFFQYQNQAAEPLGEISETFGSIQSAAASAERVFKLLDETEILPDTTLPTKLDGVRGEVRFEHVRFGYTSEKDFMKDISFTVKPGQKVAIVGSTGAGKTTLVNLLMRFYEVNGGNIYLDGVAIADMTREELRSHFGMVLQDTWLFGGTIKENISYGREDATDEEIKTAAKTARVHHFVRTMSQGYNTRLDNDVENISVGQKQLLTIARVVLCNPAVLILDEATSSVDTRTEHEINLAMKALMQDRTSFVIAHRLSTVMDADLILVMDQGNIVEQGTHDELMAKGGVYAELYNSQFAN